MDITNPKVANFFKEVALSDISYTLREQALDFMVEALTGKTPNVFIKVPNSSTTFELTRRQYNEVSDFIKTNPFKKIDAIKMLRTFTQENGFHEAGNSYAGIGLRDAKESVEGWQFGL